MQQNVSIPFLGACPRMRFRSRSLPAPTLRNLQKTMLAGKRRPRYQTYDCAFFLEMPPFVTKSLFSDELLGQCNMIILVSPDLSPIKRNESNIDFC